MADDACTPKPAGLSLSSCIAPTPHSHMQCLSTSATSGPAALNNTHRTSSTLGVILYIVSSVYNSASRNSSRLQRLLSDQRYEGEETTRRQTRTRVTVSTCVLAAQCSFIRLKDDWTGRGLLKDTEQELQPGLTAPLHHQYFWSNDSITP